MKFPHSKLFIILFMCAVLIAPFRASAQSSPQKTPPPLPQNQAPDDNDEPDIIFEPVINVTLPVTVVNGDGRFVAGLRRENFQILENNQSQPIISFQKRDGLTLNLSLVMDVSTSIRNKLNFEKGAVAEFLKRIVDNRRDRVALATFNEEVNLVQGFTNDFEKIAQTVNSITRADGQTAVYEAVVKVCAEQMKGATSKRRVILLLTDGADTASRKTLDQAIAVAQRAEVVVYAISTKGGGVFRVEGNPYHNMDDKDLKRLCKETGGDVFFPSDISQIKRALELAEESMRNQYYLVYEPTNTTNKSFRKIDVRVVGKKDVKVLTRTGYFATPQ